MWAPMASTTSGTRGTGTRRRRTSAGGEGLAKLKERQQRELAAAERVAGELHTIAEAQAAMDAAWTRVGSAIQDLAELGWSAAQIADTLSIERSRITDLLKRASTSPTPAQADTASPAAPAEVDEPGDLKPVAAAS
jgi:hypothetical protein